MKFSWEAYQANAKRTDYKRNLMAVEQVKRACRTQGSDEDRREECLEVMGTLFEAVSYEKSTGKIGPATETILELMPLWKTLARKSETKGQRKFSVWVDKLMGALPAGSTVRPSFPVLEGSGSFIIMCKETIRKLPLSVRRAIVNIPIVELRQSETMGVYCRKGQPMIAIADMDRGKQRETLLHEIAHHVLPDNGTREDRERAADAKMNEWMKLF